MSRRTKIQHLQAEQRVGRLPVDADSASLVLALAGTIQHLLMTEFPNEKKTRS
ncbi:hypothetical protein [Streptomyces clavifer]|uniref:hypothetical protein n=1 Tax=Streptomyces clavifer TaxID=68188 RepID=UPI002E80E320|nr:hypothetical protein [Streptomyces clavifer]WUC32613.1 hypothetical protein OG927_35440 [Streptomyces clavifer]